MPAAWLGKAERARVLARTARELQTTGPWLQSCVPTLLACCLQGMVKNVSAEAGDSELAEILACLPPRLQSEFLLTCARRPYGCSESVFRALRDLPLRTLNLSGGCVTVPLLVAALTPGHGATREPRFIPENWEDTYEQDACESGSTAERECLDQWSTRQVPFMGRLVTVDLSFCALLQGGDQLVGLLASQLPAMRWLLLAGSFSHYLEQGLPTLQSILALLPQLTLLDLSCTEWLLEQDLELLACARILPRLHTLGVASCPLVRTVHLRTLQRARLGLNIVCDAPLTTTAARAPR